jgi:biotin operon repressor
VDNQQISRNELAQQMNLSRSSEVWNKQAHQGLRLEHRSGFSVDSISNDFRDS